MRNRMATVLGGLAVLGLLGGCAASDESSADSDQEAEQTPPASAGVTFTPDVSPTVEPSATGKTQQGETQQVPQLVDGWEGIRSDVTIDSCPTEAGLVTAEGRVVNSADDARDIAIAVAWNAPDSTATLLQLATVEEGVPAGESIAWSVSGDLPADAGQCVVLARSGVLANE